MPSSRLIRFMLNLYPPFLGTGIVVKHMSRDFMNAEVEMKLRWYNRNFVGTHFGGSLYAMTDPFYMIMLIGVLGKEYTVWDRGATIGFLKPGNGMVRALFSITENIVAEIRAATATGNKHLHDFTVEVVDDTGTPVARVVKTLYIRKRRADADRVGR